MKVKAIALALALAVGMAALAGPGCGRKGPPVVPKAEAPEKPAPQKTLDANPAR